MGNSLGSVIVTLKEVTIKLNERYTVAQKDAIIKLYKLYTITQKDVTIKLNELYEDAKIKLEEMYEYAKPKPTGVLASWLTNSSLDRDNKRLRESIDASIVAIRKEAEKIPRGSKFEQARKFSTEADSLMDRCFNFKEVTSLESIGHTAAIFSHAPLVGAAFAAVTPILVLYAKSAGVRNLVDETLETISKITDVLTRRVKYASKENILLSVDEVEEIKILFRVLEDGIKALETVVRGRKSRLGRLLKVDVHKEKLRGWLTTTDRMIIDKSEEKLTMISYRTRYMIETQRKYFQVLTLASFVNIGLVTAVLYFVLDLRLMLREHSLFQKILREKFSEAYGLIGKISLSILRDCQSSILIDR